MGLEEYSIPTDLAPEHLRCATQSFSFLETLLMQSELCKNAESRVSQKHHMFLCFAVEADTLTLEIKVLGSQLGCPCFLFLSACQSRCCRRKRASNSIISAQYLKINNSIP